MKVVISILFVCMYDQVKGTANLLLPFPFLPSIRSNIYEWMNEWMFKRCRNNSSRHLRLVAPLGDDWPDWDVLCRSMWYSVALDCRHIIDGSQCDVHHNMYTWIIVRHHDNYLTTTHWLSPRPQSNGMVKICRSSHIH